MIRLFLVALAVSVALGQTYRLLAVVLDAGGSQVSSTDYRGGLSIAQPVASSFLAGSGYRAVLGFWHPPYSPEGIEAEEVHGQGDLSFALSGCWPNPFSHVTTISYSLPTTSDVKLDIMNTAGRAVTTLVDGNQKPGRYHVSWSIEGVPSSCLPGGIYFVRLQAGESAATRKMVLSR